MGVGADFVVAQRNIIYLRVVMGENGIEGEHFGGGNGDPTILGGYRAPTDRWIHQGHLFFPFVQAEEAVRAAPTVRRRTGRGRRHSKHHFDLQQKRNNIQIRRKIQ